MKQLWSPEGVKAAVRRWRPLAGARLLPLATLLAALSLVAVVTNAPGHYIVDNRYHPAWSPGRLFVHQAFLWDASRDLGRVNEEFWPATIGLLAFLRSLGASPEVAERLWHAGLLTIAGTGAVAVLRLFRPRIGVEHVLAGLFVMFNPYTAASLVPSNLFVNYAVAPWLLWAFVLGVRERRPWRWAAAFALLALGAGTLDVPGLVYATVPIVPAAVYLVHVERAARWRTVVAWGARALVLVLAVSAAALVKLGLGAPALADRLGRTELPQVANLVSSWGESWRGLGFWLLYFRGVDGLARPEAAPYLGSPVTVLVTFAAPCAALFFVWRSRWRPRLLFLAIMLASLVLMVGSYPPSRPPPYGRLLLGAFDRWFALWGWRNSYKAGAGWALGAGVLAAMAVGLLRSMAGQRRRLRVLTLVGTAVVLAGSSVTFWTGRLYSPNDRLDSVPAYWSEAMRWLDDQPDRGPALVLPGTSVTHYRWGRAGLDIFDPILARPVVSSSSFPWSTPQAADLVDAIDAATGRGYVPGGLAPVARRLGIRYVIIRNDLDWSSLRRPRPAQLDPLRRDPELERVATFGWAGQNVTDPRDRTTTAASERRLPPVEVYRVGGAGPGPERPGGPALLVSGDGHAWPPLARANILATAGPLRYTATMAAGALTASLAQGSPLVVTDTNRRRVVATTATTDEYSYTLGAGEELERPAADLFRRPGSQSVATFADATRITASGYGDLAAGAQPWLRPANAFDGDLRTAWQIGGGVELGAWVRVDLRRPTAVSQVALLDYPGPGTGRYVSRATLRFSDGSEISVDLVRGFARPAFAPRLTSSLEIRIDAVAGEGPTPVGFAEVTVPGLRLVEDIELPDDVFRAAAADPTLAGHLQRASMRYQFARSHTDEGHDEELVLHRRFQTLGQRRFELSGALRLSRDTSEELLDQLLPAPIGAYGSSRYGGLLTNRGGLAVDGRADTAWRGDGQAGQQLNMHFPPQPVERVQLALMADEQHTHITQLRVTVGRESQLVSVPPPSPCPPPGPCLTTLDLRFSPESQDPRGRSRTIAVGQLTVDVTRVDAAAAPFGTAPVGIAEVTVNRGAGGALREEDRSDDCSAQVVTVDGTSIPVRLDATFGQLLRQERATFRACAPLDLASGGHRLDSSTALLVDEARLSATEPPATAGGARPVTLTAVEQLSPTHLRLRVTAPDGGVVTSGQSFDRGWRARVQGRDLGPAVAMDAQSGWAVPRGTTQVDLHFRPQGMYESALAVSLAASLLCVWLVLRRQPAERRSLAHLRLRSGPPDGGHLPPRPTVGARVEADERVASPPVRVGAQPYWQPPTTPHHLPSRSGGVLDRAKGVSLGAAALAAWLLLRRRRRS